MISTLFRGPGGPSTAAAVRHALRGLCDGEVISHAALDDLTLVATELITNAVHAGASALVVRLTVHAPELELAVEDDAPGTPSARAVELRSTSGRGLQIVAAVAQDWGHCPSATGKTVWAKFTDDQ